MVPRKSLKAKASVIFDGLAPSYDRTLHYATLLQDRHWKDWLLSNARLGSADRVLDIGCGTCVLEERLERTGCDVVGLDLTAEMLRLAKRKVFRCAQNLLNGDAEALPFSTGSFDVVLSCYAVKYCNLERFASEVSRALKPGGRVVLYDFVRPRGPLSPLLALYIYGLLRAAGGLLRHVDEGVSYTLEELPGIIRRTTWNDDLTSVFRSYSLDVIERAALSGGAVEAFVAKKQP